MKHSNENWTDIIIAPDATISDAINVLNSTGKMFLLISDQEKKLLGNLTDGDLRKGLVKYNDLSTPISKIMNRHPKTVSVDTPESSVALLFRNSDIKALPVVDSLNTLHGCYFARSFTHSIQGTSELMIMAGGFGTRMGDLTKDMPKPMLEIDGKPILEHIIELAKTQGFDTFYISVYYLSQKIMSHFGNGERFNVNIKYLKESHPLGTGGSIRLLPDGDAPVVITNADILGNVNFRALVDYHILTTAQATMATHEYLIENPFGVVHAEGVRIVKLEEKPIWKTNVNAGVYVINRSARHVVAPDECIDMPEVLQRLLDDNQVVVQYPVYERFSEIGTFEKYREYVSKGNNALD